MCQAATAVAYLHKRGILHRDLKSPNFLIVKGELKVADFGMSAAIQIASSSLVSSKRKTESVGSARWLAPETTARKPVFSQKSDIFSLGLVMWEIQSRELPFAEVHQEGM